MKLINLKNKRFGKLIVIKKIDRRSKQGQVYWLCKCDCGNTNEVVGFALRYGWAKSCGKCYREPTNKIKDRSMAIWRVLFTYLKNRDRNYGGKCDLELEDFISLSIKPCFYCGMKSSNTSTDKYSKENKLYFNGLDRKDSKIGYVLKNVVPCCCACNRAKNTMTINEYKKFIKRVYKNIWK